MKMSDITHRLTSLARNLTISLATVGSLSSCESLIYDDQGDCSVHYRISFRYIKNMLGADAFGPQVTDINLYVYDKDGNLVLHQTQSRQKTVENDYYMEVDLLPGTYDLLAWCEGESLNPDAVSFSIGGGENPSLISSIGATLPLDGSASDLYSDKDITRLYHGFANDVDFPDTYGEVDINPIYLTKDTNHISILLQNLDGSNIDKSNFNITIEGSNSVLEWNNNVTTTPLFNYLPWSVENTEITSDNEHSRAAESSDDGTDTTGSYYGIIAELTTSRLLADREQYLRVENSETGETIIRIPLIQYLLIVKGKYPGVDTDQDYLDAYDDFTLMFFLGEDMTWIRSRVLINGWRIVPPQDTEL